MPPLPPIFNPVDMARAVLKRKQRADGGALSVPDEHPAIQQAQQTVDAVQPTVDTALASTPQGQTASAASLGRLLDKTRKTQVGRMVDRYQQPTVGTAVNRLHGDLTRLAQEGEPGRMWYEKSSKRILDYVGGNKDEAHKLAQLVAIYSPQTTVDVNTANAIKAYNRAKAGQKMWDGDIIDHDKSFDTIKGASDYAKSLGKNITKVPLDDSGKRFLFARHNIKGYENIATADRDLKAHLLMNEGIPFEGRKTNNFYRNLMVHIDPSLEQGSTQDLWMARAFGFHDDAVGDNSKYDFMEKLTHKLGAELGWKPQQVQAAIWTAMKTRQEAVKNLVPQEAVEKGLGAMVPDPKTGKPRFSVHEGKEDDYSSLMRERALNAVLDPGHIARSARDFSDFLDQNLAHVSWEATPSKQIAHLNGLEDKPPEVKADYHKRISEALQDDKGQDLLAQYMGILSPGTVEAPGYWEGNVNPASHLQVAATRIKAAGQRPDIDDASKDLMETYANARGLLLKQDGVGYHRPYYNPKVTAANGIEYHFDTPLTGDQIKSIGKEVEARVPDTGVIPSGPNILRVINFSGADDHRPYHRAVDNALQEAHLGDTVAYKRLFASDGNLATNDWKKSPNGEDYRSRLGASRRSDVLRYVSDVLAPKVEAVDQAFAHEHGLKRDPRLEKALRGAADTDEAVGSPAQLPKAAGGSVNHSPTDAQKSAGNYAKRSISFQGIPISIENALGSTRTGRSRNGKAWSCVLPADYGYIRRTVGADGDHVDAYVGPSTKSPLVIIGNQNDIGRGGGRFDEHKVLLGFNSERDAVDCYLKAFSDGKGRQRLGSVKAMSIDAFKNWLKSGTTTKPAHGPSIVDRALGLVARPT